MTNGFIRQKCENSRHGMKIPIYYLFIAMGIAFSGLSAQQTDWPLYRGNPGLTGVAEVKLVDQLALQWKYKIGKPVLSSAVISGGRVSWAETTVSCMPFNWPMGKRRGLTN